VGSEFVELNLSEFADVADLLALEGFEVSGDAGGGQVDNTSEGLVEERANGINRESTGGGGEGMNHGFEAKIDLPRSDDLSHILAGCKHAVFEERT
jgi:hypothetical protein